jgi:hypothetical protein
MRDRLRSMVARLRPITWKSAWAPLHTAHSAPFDSMKERAS